MFIRGRAFLLLFATSVVTWAQLPNVPAGGIINGASFANQPIAVGSLISIFGTNLSSSLQHADTVPLSKSLGGVTVQFVNGNTTLSAPMLDTIPPANQLNVEVPWGIVPPNAPAQTVNVIVTVAGVGSSQPTPVTVGPFSPGIFTTGQNLAIVQNNTDGTLAQPPGSVSGLTTHPAKHGDVLIIYATGLGAVDSPPADGAAAGQVQRNTLTPPIVMVGNMSATVIGTALSPQFVGVYQVAIFVPDNAPIGNAVSLQIQMGGVTSPANVTMAVSQ